MSEPAEEIETGHERWHGVYFAVGERLQVVLNERLLTTYKAQRKIELETQFEGRAATNNLLDVLAHLGTLLQQAPHLTYEQQMDHVVNVQDHLRRAVMEGQEEVVNALLDGVAAKWEEYQQKAAPLRAELGPVATHEQLQQLRNKIGKLLDEGRATKPDSTWDQHLEGAGYFREAAQTAQELLDKLDMCLGAAARATEDRHRQNEIDANRRKDRRLAIAGFVVGVVGVIAGIGLPLLMG
jgi:hypothetical protein